MRPPNAEELKKLFDLSVDMMCIIDNSTILVANPALIAGLGYAEEELVGQPFMDRVHPDDRESVLQAIASLFDGESSVAFEMRIRTGSGEMRWFSWSSRADVEAGLIYASGRDVTNQRSANERLQKYTDMLERSQRELKEALEELGHIASTDPLTGLLNRRGFESRAAAEISRSERHGRPVGLVFFDIDNFKRVNDEHGHPVGDVVLREVARRMQASSRQEDIVARWGGEEFAVLFPETTLQEAQLGAERIALSISARPFVLGSATLSIRVSGGVTAALGSELESTLELIGAADSLLLRAKRNGRDRIEVSELNKLKLAS